MEAVEVRLNNHEARLEASHQSLSTLRSDSARHETAISVMGMEIREVRDDVAEMKRQLVNDSLARKQERERDREERRREREEQKKESADTKRSLYVTASFFATFTVALLGLTATLLNG